MSATIDILAIGEPMVEFNEDRSGPAPLYRPGHGGDTSNTIIAAARPGARTAYFTHLGDDAFGKQFLDLWDKEGVDRKAVKLVDGQRTGIYFVTHGPNGHEFSYYRAASAASGPSAGLVLPDHRRIARQRGPIETDVGVGVLERLADPERPFPARARDRARHAAMACSVSGGTRYHSLCMRCCRRSFTLTG